MHIKNIVFVSQMPTPTTQTGIVIPSGAIGGGSSAFGYHICMNPSNMYHMRQMSSYRQHQQQQQFLPPHHGYSHFPHCPAHYCPKMNHQPLAPTQQLLPIHGSFNTMWSTNNNNIGQSNIIYQQQQYNYKKSLVNITELPSNNKLGESLVNNTELPSNNKLEESLVNNTELLSYNNLEKSSSSTTTLTSTSKNKNRNRNRNRNKKQTETRENFSEISFKDQKNNNNKNNNKEIIFEKPPQKQQKSENTSIDPVRNIKKTSIIQSTTLSKFKRSDSKSSNMPLKSVNKDINNHVQQNNKNDTMQRNSSKASHTPTKSHQNKEQHNIKNESSDSGIPANGHHHHHHHHNSSSYSSKTAKQRKSYNSSKRQDAAINTTNVNTTNGQKRRGSSEFTVNDYWLHNDMYCYEEQFISSCVEDNMVSRHNSAHRNSTSSEAAGSDDLNSSSSNEDLCTVYSIQSKSSKKSKKSRQRRQQKRKQLGANGNNSNNIIINIAQSMDINEESKENIKPSNGRKQTSSAAAINLRKECTKSAALKAALKNTKYTKCSSNALTTSASNSSVCSSLSSASSTSSINFSISSSASSSPTHSANTSPTASPTASKRNAEHLKQVSQSFIPPLRQFTKLNLSERELVQQMKRYLIDPSLFRVYGFPVESVHHEGCIEIYKCLPKHLAEEAVTKDNQRHHRHLYVPKKSNVVNTCDGLCSGSSSQQWYNSTSVDSGHGSGDSSPRFTDSDSSEMCEDDTTTTPIMAFYTPDGVYQIFPEYYNTVEKQCVRCSKTFNVNDEGEYLTFESCTYHWGKLNMAHNGKCYANIYTCCQGEELSEGCSQHPLHVWNGTVIGVNGPYTDFVHTQPKKSNDNRHPKIYAIDCEMSYTGLGLEVTKVTVVGYDGSLVYEHFVIPQADIVDYNTRYSGISEKDLSTDSNNSIKTFAEVQQDLLNLFDADTILIGHGLDNDLRVLRLVHKTIVDTSLVFNHSTGYPYRRSLKNLTKTFLKHDIQCGDMGHSSFEDSRACLELMIWKVHKDLRHWSYQ